MKFNKITKPNNLTLEQAYLEFTELLVRDFGLSLNFLNHTPPKKKGNKTRRSPAYKPDDLLNTQQAADVLGLSKKTLNNWRSSGIPNLQYRRIGGAIRYQYSDLIAFSDNNKRSNTSNNATVKIQTP